MKNIILAALFIVTWNEYELKLKKYPNGDYPLPLAYTVETVDKLIKLATKEDKNKFLGEEQGEVLVKEKHITISRESKKLKSKLISDKAFNIKVREDK